MNASVSCLLALRGGRPPHAVRRAVRRRAGPASAAATWLAMRSAQADAVLPGPEDVPPGGSDFAQVLGRLDPVTLWLGAALLLILLLLGWRVARMIRHERPTATPSPRRAPRTVVPPEADTLARPTSWGFDENKRAALARSPVTVARVESELPSLEEAVTQWTMTDIGNAHAAGVQPGDALGQSPHASSGPYRTGANPYFKRDLPVSQFEVVEVADALLQAELLVQLGDPKQAMTLLSLHIRETEKPGPAAWLMLLGLYQSTGREAQYNALSTGFRALFNAEVPPWAQSPDLVARDLESYAPVLERVQTVWRDGQARGFVESLLNDDRGGSRQGFSLNAYRELLFLIEILDARDAMEVEEAERQGIRRKLAASV